MPQRVMLIILIQLVLAGCVGGPAPSPPVSRELLRWPAAPTESRIEWVREISEPRDLGLGKGFWTRLVELVTGEENVKIVRPYGVFVDAEGRIFVADAGASVVHLYDTKRSRYVRLKGTDETPLQLPIGIAGDGTGAVYVTDSAAGAVYRYTPGEELLKPFISRGLERPTGIACDRALGRLYLSDTSRHQIVVYDLTGRELSRIGSRGSNEGEFNYPTDLCLDRQGRLMVTDSLNFRIQILTAEGSFIATIGSPGDRAGYLSKPKGVAVDSDGHYYIADALLDTVQIFNEAGHLLLNFGMRGNRPGEFWMPSGLFIDGHDDIYVADTYNNRIQVFHYHHRSGNGNPS